MGCSKAVVKQPIICPNPPQTPVVIPNEWTIQWLGLNAKAVIEAYKIQQETIKCYEKQFK